MDLGLKDRVALVCGASRGIAYAAADALAQEGMRLAVVSRSHAAIDSAASRLRAHGGEVLAIEADLASAGGPATAAAAALDRFGQVDVLITNTGGPPTGAALEHPWSAWESATSLLLKSAVELTAALVPGMQSRGWGRVVGITSFAVKQPVPSLVLSNSLRAAVTGFFRTLAEEVAPDGVTVNSVLPGFTATERLDDLATATTARLGITREEVFDKWRAQTPAGRLGAPEEVAAMIAFLASVPAGYVTGQAICVDGGAARSLL